MKVKNPPKIIGDLDWSELRDFLIVEMSNAYKEEEFVKIISVLLASYGTLKQIKKVRKQLGIKSLTKEEEERLK